jgi:hypothetical protein
MPRSNCFFSISPLPSSPPSLSPPNTYTQIHTNIKVQRYYCVSDADSRITGTYAEDVRFFWNASTSLIVSHQTLILPPPLSPPPLPTIDC